MENQELIQTLRQKTLLPLSECKEALTAVNNDLDAAILFLQKKGLKKVEDVIQNRHGQVRAYANGFVIEVNCETEATAKSNEFNELLNLLEQQLPTHRGVIEKILDIKLNEKLTLNKVQQLSALPDGHFAVYNHTGGTVAVVLQYSVKDDNKETQELATNCAMQVAAMKPLAVSSEQLDANLVETKRNLLAEEISGKPPQIRDKIVEGKLSKYFSEVCLVNQEAIWQPKTKILDLINKYEEFVVNSFIRLERGLD